MMECPNCFVEIGAHAHSSLDMWYVGAAMGPFGNGNSSTPKPKPQSHCPNCKFPIIQCPNCNQVIPVDKPKPSGGGRGVIGMGNVVHKFKRGAGVLTKHAANAVNAAENAFANVPSNAKNALGAVAAAGLTAAALANPFAMAGA